MMTASSKFQTLIVNFEDILSYNLIGTDNSVTKAHKKGKSMVKLNVKLAEDDVKTVQKAHAKHEACTETMRKLIETGGASEDILNRYEDRQGAALLAFEQAKDRLAEKYVPECLYNKHECQWELNYNTREMTISVLCECGRAALDEAGLAYEEA